MKRCSKCGIEKGLSEFAKDNSRKDGYRSQCKACIKEYNDANKEKTKEYIKEYHKANKEKKREYYEVNKERIKEREKIYREANKEKRKERDKVYREANKEKKREWYEANKERIKERDKEYYEVNKERIKEKKREYYEVNKEYYKEYHKEYYKEYREANKEIIKEKNNAYKKARRKTDPLYKVRGNISNNIRNALKRQGYSKKSKTHEILGCSHEEFRNHIESQFGEGMTWDNMGEWHLDHKIPVSYGLTEEELRALNHYSNFQPLWGDDNIKKGNRWMD